MTITIDKEFVTELDKDIKKLCKKYWHLEEDLKTAEKFLIAQPINHNAPEISGLGGGLTARIFKLRKFYSTDFSGKGSHSGFRLIYAYNKSDEKIIFIELYHKSQQSNHDVQRIHKYFKLN